MATSNKVPVYLCRQVQGVSQQAVWAKLMGQSGKIVDGQMVLLLTSILCLWLVINMQTLFLNTLRSRERQVFTWRVNDNCSQKHKHIAIKAPNPHEAHQCPQNQLQISLIGNFHHNFCDTMPINCLVWNATITFKKILLVEMYQI